MKERQKDRVLAALKAGGTDLRDWPPGFRLAARIADLKADGHDIDSKNIRLPGGAHCARYTLRFGPEQYPQRDRWDKVFRAE